MAANIKQEAQKLRELVIASINQANQDLHAAGGVKIEIQQNPAKQIQTLVRDATARVEQQINWTSAYQMRTLSFLMTAITLVEIHSEHAGSKKALEQLNVLLPLITDPSLWNPEEKAKENFSHYVKEMSSALKEIKVEEKSFQYANGWVSVDLPPQTIETKSSINGTVYITRSEPICELTPEIKIEFQRILICELTPEIKIEFQRILKAKENGFKQFLPIWYLKLDNKSKKLCIYYAEKIKKGELHQLTPGLRGLVPGLKNAYKTTLIREGKEGEQDTELLSFYHTATVPIGSEALETEENVALTKLGYKAMQGTSKDVVVYTTLVSRHGDSLQDKMHKVEVAKSRIKNLVGSDTVDEPKRPELIDHIINEFSKKVAKLMRKEGLPFYHTNVCLNGARRFERSKVQGLNKVLEIIEQKINDCPGGDLRNELLKQHKEAKKEVKDLSAQIQTMIDGDDEMRAYKGLFAFAKLVHNYNQNEDVNQGVKIRWYFGCASGQNRTQALSYSLMNQAICEDQMGPNSRALSPLEMEEIATRLAEDGHFTYINGPYDAKFGIRSKSAGSFPKSLFRAIQSMILSLADTKRPNDVLFEPKKMNDFFAELNGKPSLSTEELILIWEKYVHGKSGIALNDIELLGVLGALMELNQRYKMADISDNKYAFLLNLAFREQRLAFLFCKQGNQYKEAFTWVQILDNALRDNVIDESQLEQLIAEFFRTTESLTVEEAYKLLLAIYPDAKNSIDAAYKNRDKIESESQAADSERGNESDSSDLAESDDNGNGTPLRDEENVVSVKNHITMLSTNLADIEQLVAAEVRFISSLLADGKLDLAYEHAAQLVDATLYIDAIQNNAPLRDALENLREQVSLPKKQDNEKNKPLATKALLLVAQEVLNCAQYVSEPKKVGRENRVYKPIITSEKMQEIIGKKLKTEQPFWVRWRKGIVNVVKKISDLLLGLDASPSPAPKKYQESLLKYAHDYNDAMGKLKQKGATFLEGAAAEDAIEAAVKISTGKTPLHSAVIESPDNISKLIDDGANVNATDDKGKTPLHYAIPGDNNLVQLLIDNKANVDLQDMHGKTPLHYAVEFGDRKAVEILLKADAKADTYDSQGKTPKDYALELDEADIFNLLDGEPVDCKVYSAQELRAQSVKEAAIEELSAHKKATASRLPPDDFVTLDSPPPLRSKSSASLLPRCGFFATGRDHAESPDNLKLVEPESLDI